MGDGQGLDSVRAVRGSIFHFTDDPDLKQDCYEYTEDGVLIIKNGLIEECGRYLDLVERIPPEARENDYRGKIILPGFIDTHLHYPQTDIIASYGKQLLDWLDAYTFPREGMCDDLDYVEDVLEFFLEELLRNGTTTAQVMTTVHKLSVESLFRKCLEKNLRMISGKMMMDRNAPEFLVDTPESGYDESMDLIKTWHNKGRLHYSVSPRFAVTSTEAQLEKAAALLESADGLYLQTHLAENPAEVQMVSELFPWADDYLAVYEKFGLLTPRSLFAHSIHLSDDEYCRLAESGSAIAFCPTSNLFIGSGLFDLEKPQSYGVPVAMGTDVGGGTSFSMLRTLGEAYKVLQLKGQSLSSLKAFYLATLGGARALRLEDKIGTLKPGTEADVIVLNLDGTPLIQRRMEEAHSIEDRLFVLMILGDDRCVDATYISGERVYSRYYGSINVRTETG